ncbi:MAG TPA: hypothetical protein ENI33_07485 [Thermoplasmatales archaeon]|nr:hypothetical protein [Thermoplasmatales archaeon]
MKYEGIDNTKSIPLSSIRRIMERYCPYHISMEAVMALRNLIEEITSKITMDAVEKFEKMNKCREAHGLSKLKRLNAWAVKNSEYNINIINGKQNMMNEGLQSQGVVTLGGGKMPAGINTAKPDTTNDQKEVV